MVAASVKLHYITSHKTIKFIVQNVLPCGLYTPRSCNVPWQDRYSTNQCSTFIVSAVTRHHRNSWTIQEIYSTYKINVHILKNLKPDVHFAGVYACLWESCGFQSSDPKVIVRHVNFHAFHTKIKCIGSNILAQSRHPVSDWYSACVCIVCLW